MRKVQECLPHPPFRSKPSTSPGCRRPASGEACGEAPATNEAVGTECGGWHGGRGTATPFPSPLGGRGVHPSFSRA